MSKTANFSVDPRLTSILGENYSSSERALRELVDNAWDAEATTVQITLPDILNDAPIVIADNGSGMKEQELRQEYLNIANPRYTRKGEKTPNLQRTVKGRRGIGKFAGLILASQMEVETKAHGTQTAGEFVNMPPDVPWWATTARTPTTCREHPQNLTAPPNINAPAQTSRRC